MISSYTTEHVEALQAVDSCYWAVKNRIKLLGGVEFTLDGCGYLAEIMRDETPEKAIQKAAQSRITTIFMLDCIHGMSYNRYPQGVIYYFPTERSVEAFSKTRFGPLVADNSVIRRRMRNTNSVSIKRVGNTFLRLLGTSATKIIQGKKDSTSVRSEPADYIIRDERDLFDDDMVEQTKQRILNSKVAKEVDLGTPTIPDYGIAKAFNDSDQRYWMTPCSKCNEYTCITLEFPNSIKFKDGQPYMACIKCGCEINPEEGEWVAKYPGRRVAGWLVSHFMTPNINLPKVMDRWERAQRDNKVGEFYNAILGQPYIAAEDKLKISDVMACCGDEQIASISMAGTAMGVDTGKPYHVIIAQKVDKDRARVIFLGRVADFGIVHDLAKKFNVKSAVADLRPYEESFRKFQAREPYKVFGCAYQDKMKGFQKTDEQAGVYTIARTEMFDKTHGWVRNKQIELPRNCDEVQVYAKQMCNCAKVLEENERGDRIYRYRKLGDDHYRSATNYLYLALQNLYDYDVNPVPALTAKENDWNPLTLGLN